MAAVAVSPKTMAAGEVVQWQNTAESLTDIKTLVGASNVKAPVVGGLASIEVTLEGVTKKVNHLDYVLVCLDEEDAVVDTAVLTPAEYARYYELT